ncbi:hypothetical protein BpHYR1_023814, partial [Brachionus plicatilis]
MKKSQASISILWTTSDSTTVRTNTPQTSSLGLTSASTAIRINQASTSTLRATTNSTTVRTNQASEHSESTIIAPNKNTTVASENVSFLISGP